MNELFGLYQPQLLKLANSKYGREFLGIKDKDLIVKLTPNSYHTLIGRNKFRGTFISAPIYAKRLGLSLSKLDIAREAFRFNQYKGLLNYVGLLESRRFPTVLATVTNFLSNAGGDGSLYANNATWAGSHDDTTGQTDVPQVRIATLWDSIYSIGRGFTPFDTSALTAGATITAATLSLHESTSHTVYTDGGTFTLGVQESTEVDPTALAAADYNNFNATELITRVNFTSITLNDYTDFTLNAAGLAIISKTSYTKLIIREGAHDIDDSTCGTGGYGVVVFSSAADAGAEPTLAVTYTLPAGTSGLMSKYF